jgi:hypothetical protein
METNHAPEQQRLAQMMMMKIVKKMRLTVMMSFGLVFSGRSPFGRSRYILNVTNIACLMVGSSVR